MKLKIKINSETGDFDVTKDQEIINETFTIKFLMMEFWRSNDCFKLIQLIKK
jgi:hypothetical protein